VLGVQGHEALLLLVLVVMAPQTLRLAMLSVVMVSLSMMALTKISQVGLLLVEVHQ